MPDPHAANRFGWPGYDGPLRSPAVEFRPGDDAREVRVRLATAADTAEFCAWLGLSGLRDFAAFKARPTDGG